MTTEDEIKKLKRPNMVTKVKQQIVKEEINETNLSSLPRDFYKQVHIWLQDATEAEKKDIQWQLNRLFRKRNGKLLNYASVDSPENYHCNLADEEWQFCELMFKESEKLKNKIIKRVESRE